MIICYLKTYNSKNLFVLDRKPHKCAQIICMKNNYLKLYLFTNFYWLIEAIELSETEIVYTVKSTNP